MKLFDLDQFEAEDFSGEGLGVVEHFSPVKIVLTKGSDRTSSQARLVEAICSVYPQAEVVDRRDISHNRFELGTSDPLERHSRGKQTLVLGEHKSAVRFSDEQDNSCPNYWHFSPYGFCPYGCRYCYLAGTPGVWFSPTVKVFLNLDEILKKMDRVARTQARPTVFYLGKLQDGLALDPLTGYSRRLIPFFADHPYARMILLTKSTAVANLLPLHHNRKTTLSWSLASESVWRQYEPNTPSPDDRLAAMSRCDQAGYPLRAMLMPILPTDDWRQGYAKLLDSLLSLQNLERITLGSLCSYPNALQLSRRKLPAADSLFRWLGDGETSRDGRTRFAESQRLACYRFCLDTIAARRPDIQTSLCMESPHLFHQLNIPRTIGRCNCVL